MENLKLSSCYEQTVADAIGSKGSIVTKPLILAVDDDEDNLLLMAYTLEHLDCCLLTAVDGLSTLSLARTCQPDLILLDVLLPYMDGAEVVSQLRQDPKTQSIPVIAVTALANAADRERLLLAGCNDYVTKPYMLDDIEAKVRHYLPLQAAIS